MLKKDLINHIQKYYLNGSCKSVRWEISDGNTIVDFLTDDKGMLGSVQSKNLSLNDGVFATNATDRLLSILGALSDEISCKYDISRKEIVGMNFADEVVTVYFAGGDLKATFDPGNILANYRDRGRKLKSDPENVCNFQLSDEFIKRFVKSKKAISEAKIVAFDKDKFIINYSELNTNRILIPVDVIGNNTEFYVYNIDHLFNILSVNDDMKSGSIEISNMGLLTIEFENDYSESLYYLNPINMK